MEQRTSMTDEITQALLTQLAKQQAEIDAKQIELEKLEKENKKLKSKSGTTQKTRCNGIYMKIKKNGQKVYGFTIRDENFKKIRRQHYSTLAEAEADRRRLLDLKDESKLSTHVANQKQTFEFLCDAYITNAEAENFAINTIEAAKGTIKNHLDFFKDIPILKCTVLKAQEWSKLKRKQTKPSAFNNALKLARAIWNNGIDKNLTKQENPFEKISPINIKKEHKTRQDVRIDKEQADLILKTVKQMYGDTDYTYPAIAVATYELLREGETLGLFWSDIDFSNGTVFVQRQVQKVTKKIIKEKLLENPNLTERDIILTDRLKSESSKEILPIPKILLNILKEYKKTLMKEGKLHELCFCKEDGSPLVARDFVRYKFQPVLKKLFGDEKYMHFHELRGSGAQILHFEGVPSKVIQALLRHSRLSVTEDIYMKKAKQEEIRKYLDEIHTA